jgi:hypothetical protein
VAATERRIQFYYYANFPLLTIIARSPKYRADQFTDYAFDGWFESPSEAVPPTDESCPYPRHAGLDPASMFLDTTWIPVPDGVEDDVPARE